MSVNVEFISFQSGCDGLFQMRICGSSTGYAVGIDPTSQFTYIRYASRAGLTRFEIDVAQGRLIHPTEVLSEMVPLALAFTAIIQ